MKITILTVGSRGDVQPLIALGKELLENGIEILVTAHVEHELLVKKNGLEFAEMPNNPTNKWEVSEKSKNERKSLWDQIEPDAALWLETGLEVCKDADAIIYNSLYSVGQHLGEGLNIPFYQVVFEPSLPTKEFPTAYFPIQQNMGAWLNKLSYYIGSQIFWQQIRKGFNHFRKEKLGLGPIDWKGPLNKLIKEDKSILCCFSSFLVKKPSDWNKKTNISGYWYLKLTQEYTPPHELQEFLENGPKPLFFDFGSFAHDLMREKIKIILNEISKSGHRLVVAPGKINLEKHSLPTDTFIISNDVPHEWLLPRIFSIISHGGVGVVHASLKAGIPTIPISIFAAQYYWGNRLYNLGLSAKPIKIRKLRKGDVLERIEFIDNQSTLLLKNLEMAKKYISDEDGAKKVAQLIISNLKNGI